MGNESTTALRASPRLQRTQVYGFAAVCLVLGLGMGYLLEGTQAHVASPRTTLSASAGSGNAVVSPGVQSSNIQGQPTAQAGQTNPPHGAMGHGSMPTMQDMKRMADKQAAPLLEKLKSDPKNSAVLAQVGGIYHSTHQFKEATTYFGKAVEADPKNVAIRTKLAISLYRDGDTDQAIAQLNLALKQDPKDANALFNLGMIKLQGKQDSKGAVAAWQKLLKTNPQLSSDRRAMVQKMMADVLTSQADEHQIQGTGRHDQQKPNSN